MCATRNSRRDKNALAWPSEAISNVLRSIPETMKPVMTAADWASTNIPNALGLDHEDHRAFFNRLLTWYLINQSDQIKAPIPPRTIRKTLQRKADQFRGWMDQLNSLNSTRRCSRHVPKFWPVRLWQRKRKMLARKSPACKQV